MRAEYVRNSNWKRCKQGLFMDNKDGHLIDVLFKKNLIAA